MIVTSCQLEEKELVIYRFLTENYPEWQSTYLQLVPEARLLIMERLVNALFREGFVEKEELEYKLSQGNLIELPFSKGKITISIARRYSYNRFELTDSILFSNFENVLHENVHPNELITLILEYMEAENMAYTNLVGFETELANSVANMGLSLLFQKKLNQQYKRKSEQNFWGTTMELVDGLANLDPDFDRSLFFEQMCVTGHQLHPCTKSKMGLCIEDIIQYSAEFNQVVPLQFIALHNNIIYHNPYFEREQLNRFWQKEFPVVFDRFCSLCLEKGKNVDDFIILPVHPWQKKETIPKLYSTELRRGELFFIDDVEMPTKPTLSVRTVVPLMAENKFHFKLPINVQMTSAVRTISPNSVHNGPELTLILQEILQKEDYYNETINIIGEDIGYRFLSRLENDLNRNNRNKNLSLLVRSNPESLVNSTEYAVVACALYQPSPVSGDLLLYEIIDQFQRLHSIDKGTDHVLTFFQKYIDILLEGVISLMTQYGIALEAHLQNTLIIFKDYEPIKIFVRDLGGVRVVRERLEKQGIEGNFYPNSVTIGDDVVEMQNKVIHTVFQSQIGELTSHIAKKYPMDEPVLWNIVREKCLEVFSNLYQTESLKDAVDSDKAALLAPTVQTKALTLMRLTDDVTDYAYITVPNPVATSV